MEGKIRGGCRAFEESIIGHTDLKPALRKQEGSSLPDDIQEELYKKNYTRRTEVHCVWKASSI